MRKIILVCAVFFCCSDHSYAQAGNLDSLFGTAGIVTTDFGFPFDYNYATTGRQALSLPDGSLYVLIEAANLSFITRRLSNGTIDLTYGNSGFSHSLGVLNACAALEPGGKIVVAGINPNGSFTVGRFNTDGTPDKTFSNDGKQVGDFGYEENIANSILVQSDGKIIVGGYVNTDAGWDFGIARFTADGQPDVTFDTDGKQTTDFNGADDVGSGIAIQSNGKIIMVGQTSLNGTHDFAIARYNADGSPDNTFSADGKRTTDFDSSEDIAKSVAVQSDGKIVVAGYVYKCNSTTCSNAEFAVARYNVNGTLDNTFSTDGKQMTAFNSGYYTTSLIIQANGKIVVGGYGFPGNSSDFALARFNTNGSIDNTFNGDGKQTTQFTGNCYINSIVMQSDGKIVATGTDDNSTFDLARYNIDGDLDNSFDIDGKLSDRLHLNQGSTFFTSTAIQSDGKIVAAGYTWNGNNYDFALARYNMNGSLDSSFSGDGRQMSDFDSFDDFAYALAIQKDGKIILAGEADSNFALARYNIDGSPDNTFGNGGKETTDLGFMVYDEARAIVVTNSGKIILAGKCLAEVDHNTSQFISDFAVAVYNADGSADQSFSGDGKLATDLGYDDIANGVAIQPDGKILVAGESQDERKEISLFALARYNADGTADAAFSGDGRQFTSFPAISHANSIAVQQDGKIIVAGNTGYEQGFSSDFAIARYDPDGKPDNSFSGNGIKTTHFGTVFPFSSPLIIQTDGKILIAGSTKGDFTMARYTVSGILDNEFSDDGIQITNASDGEDRIEGIAIKDNSLYAAGYGQYPGNLGVVARYLLAPGIVLPINLVDFTAAPENTTVFLRWETPGAENFSRFIVERSTNGGIFLPLATVPALATNMLTKTYSVVDAHPEEGINFYRLKMINADEKFAYSKIIAIKKDNGNKQVQIFPNPAKNTLFIQATGYSGSTTIRISDVNGKMIKEQIAYLTSGTLVPIDISALPAGMYNMVLQQKGMSKAQKFVKR